MLMHVRVALTMNTVAMTACGFYKHVYTVRRHAERRRSACQCMTGQIGHAVTVKGREAMPSFLAGVTVQILKL
jgi:hypothetical protein